MLRTQSGLQFGRMNTVVSTAELESVSGIVRDDGLLELQRMFEYSNIIRLRFSRTNFFYERTFVDARWSVFGAHTAEREASAAASRLGAVYEWRYS